VGSLAIKVLDQGVGGVRLEANAVVPIDDVAVGDADGIATVYVPPVGVLRLRTIRLD